MGKDFDNVDDWFSSKPRLKRARNSTGFTSVKLVKPTKPVTPKELISNKRIPEVMVKISGSSKDVGRIKSHVDYISRNGNVDVIDQDGNVIKGHSEVRDLKKQWESVGIPNENGRFREAFHIVLSMPPNTDPDRMYNAVKNFASEEFSSHKYVMAQHLDEKHPHVHICVMARDIDGKRLNPRKNDLQAWREEFANKLKEQGIEAKATKRIQRLRYKKPEKSNVRNWREEAKGNFKQGRTTRHREMPQSYKDRITKLSKYNQPPKNEYEDKVLKTHKDIVGKLEKIIPEEVKNSKDWVDFKKQSEKLEPTAEQLLFVEIQKQLKQQVEHERSKQKQIDKANIDRVKLDSEINR